MLFLPCTHTCHPKKKKCMKLYSLLISLFLCPGVFAQDTLLTVGDAIKIALENNYSIIISKSEIEIGRINNNWAEAGAYPEINATATKGAELHFLKQRKDDGTVT